MGFNTDTVDISWLMLELAISWRIGRFTTFPSSLLPSGHIGLEFSQKIAYL